MKSYVRYSTLLAALSLAVIITIAIVALPVQSLASYLVADEEVLAENAVVQVIPNRANRLLSEWISSGNSFSLSALILETINPSAEGQSQQDSLPAIELSSKQLAESELIVVDISDETTAVIAPVVGQVLMAQIEAPLEATAEATAELDFIQNLDFAETPFQEVNASFNWHYADYPEDSLSTETTLMVGADSIGQILALTVTLEIEAEEGAAEYGAIEEESEAEDIVLTWTAEEPVRVLLDLDALTVLESSKVFGECYTTAYPPLTEDLLTDWPYLVDPADFEIELWRTPGTLVGSYNVYAKFNYDGDRHTIVSQFDDYQKLVGEGKFQIIKRPITVTAASDSRVYDGTPLTNPTWTLSEGALLDGHTIAVVVSGSQTVVGASENVVMSVKITEEVDGVESDLTSNYDFTFEVGTLTVTPGAGQTPPQDDGSGSGGSGSGGGGSGGGGAGSGGSGSGSGAGSGGSGGGSGSGTTGGTQQNETPAAGTSSGTGTGTGTPRRVVAVTPGSDAEADASTDDDAEEANEEEEYATPEPISATGTDDGQREPRVAPAANYIDESAPFDWAWLTTALAVSALIGLAVAIFFLVRKLDLMNKSS